MKNIKSPIIVALDYDNAAQATAMLDALDPQLCRVKIGKALFTRLGPQIVHAAMSRGFEVFLDLKFHDIPNTVAEAVKSCADLGVWMCNVHASGGVKMMCAAVDALKDRTEKPLLIGVTVLTSLTEAEVAEIGYGLKTADLAMQFAKQALDAGLDGVVCSAWEAPTLRSLSSDFLLVTPGIRLPDSVADDQARVKTPSEAMASGSNYLVIGRPITGAKEPVKVLEAIVASL